uniref:Tetratricopeptide repeat-containing protein n=1 Tax=Candidatus Kentrum sp. FW TaxID=2126338 RepID=A0A450S684_9GAMM|nr:MAG: Tetratricopeptide repeat-containing protein [Candidatus Kentron sp. FW]
MKILTNIKSWFDKLRNAYPKPKTSSPAKPIPPELQAQLAQFRAANPELKAASDEQLMELIPRVMRHMADIDPTDEAALDRMSAADLGILGEQLLEQGKWPEAEPVLLRALERSEQEGDVDNRISAAGLLGRLCRDRRDFAEAHTLLQQVLGLAERLDDKWWQGTIFHDIGTTHAMQSQYHQAIVHYKKSLEIAKALGNELEMVVNYTRLFPKLGSEKETLLRRATEVRILANTVVTNMFVCRG